MSEQGAKIVDTKAMIGELDNNERFNKIKTTKKLNKMATLEVEGEMSKKKNPFEGLKISKAALRKKSTRKKKPTIDFSRFTVEGYTYDEFSTSVNKSIPHVINHISFQDEDFLQKLKKSKDISHFADTQIMFPITNDWLGLAGAIIGAGISFYTEKKLGIKQDESKKEEGKEANQKNENLEILKQYSEKEVS